MSKAPISLLSWVHNEEKNMEEWLSQLSPYVEEIILVDVESTDRTVEIAKKFTEKVHLRPFLMCGDSYRAELLVEATQPWILWTYPDERWPERTLQSFQKLMLQDRWNSYAFMRHEYLDEVRVDFEQGGKKIAHGTAESPNYQTRLFRRGMYLFWTEMIHAEYHGPAVVCPLPPEYYFEHKKTRDDQEFDNYRSYIWMKELVWKYGNTQIEPYRRYVHSYRDVIRQSEVLNLSGERKISLAEEFWWKWWEYKDEPRITLEAFKERFGISYVDFLRGTDSLVGRVDKVYAG